MKSSTSTNFSDYVFKSVPLKNSFKNLHVGQPVAITIEGMREHNDHHHTGRIFAAAGVGALGLATSGLGFGVVGSLGAFGIGAAELALVGAAGCAITAANLNQGLKYYGKAEQFKGLETLGVVGIVQEFDTHWWDSECKVVRVRWYTHDNNGVLRPRDDWHTTDCLVGLETKESAIQKDAAEAARRAEAARKAAEAAKAAAAKKSASTTSTSKPSGLTPTQRLWAGVVGLSVLLGASITTLHVAESALSVESASIEQTY